MRTAESVAELGLYTSMCCGNDCIFDTLDTFQRCPKCGHFCDWEFTERVIDYMQLEREVA